VNKFRFRTFYDIQYKNKKVGAKRKIYLNLPLSLNLTNLIKYSIRELKVIYQLLEGLLYPFFW
jgi:hypothetical protein